VIDAPDGRPQRILRQPTCRQRAVVAIALAFVAAGLLLRSYFIQADFKADFSVAWFGASALLHGANPYALVGPGKIYDWEWPLLYPVTALVPVIPFTIFSEQTAALVFIWLSTFLLAWGVTAKSWHLLPIFASEAFASSARLAQWSIFMTAALYIPLLACLAVVKPPAALPVLAATRSQLALLAALAGTALLTAASFALFPAWPTAWLSNLATAPYMVAPITRLGGIFVLLVLLRWRRPEAWLVLVLACMPQTWGWYNVLLLLTVAATFREACALVVISSLGAFFCDFFLEGESVASVSAIMVATAYLPAALVVLRRPNEGAGPGWMIFLRRLASSSLAVANGARRSQA